MTTQRLCTVGRRTCKHASSEAGVWYRGQVDEWMSGRAHDQGKREGKLRPQERGKLNLYSDACDGSN